MLAGMQHLPGRRVHNPQKAVMPDRQSPAVRRKRRAAPPRLQRDASQASDRYPFPCLTRQRHPFHVIAAQDRQHSFIRAPRPFHHAAIRWHSMRRTIRSRPKQQVARRSTPRRIRGQQHHDPSPTRTELRLATRQPRRIPRPNRQRPTRQQP